MPLFVNFGEERFRDGVDLSHAQFYERLRRQAVLPTTSQPTSAMFEDAFRPHVDAGREIVCVTINAKLSGTINAATAAAQQFPGAPITIVAVNDALTANPALLNTDPYGEGWIFKLTVEAGEEIEKLKSPAQYREQIGSADPQSGTDL